jgi:GNAT superfamily N-acetyltransferase
MPDQVIRMAVPSDVPALAALRRAAAAERDGGLPDDGFGARFAAWYERQSGSRVTWLAELAGVPVGLMSLAVFERMPRPGRDSGRWGYLGNAFVLPAHRDQGVGSRLLAAVLGYADEHGFARVVLSPSERSVPFYQRAGFGPADALLLRPGPAIRLPDRDRLGTAPGQCADCASGQLSRVVRLVRQRDSPGAPPVTVEHRRCWGPAVAADFP